MFQNLPFEGEIANKCQSRAQNLDVCSPEKEHCKGVQREDHSSPLSPDSRVSVISGERMAGIGTISLPSSGYILVSSRLGDSQKRKTPFTKIKTTYCLLFQGHANLTSLTVSLRRKPTYELSSGGKQLSLSLARLPRASAAILL